MTSNRSSILYSKYIGNLALPSSMFWPWGLCLSQRLCPAWARILSSHDKRTIIVTSRYLSDEQYPCVLYLNWAQKSYIYIISLFYDRFLIIKYLSRIKMDEESDSVVSTTSSFPERKESAIKAHCREPLDDEPNRSNKGQLLYYYRHCPSWFALTTTNMKVYLALSYDITIVLSLKSKKTISFSTSLTSDVQTLLSLYNDLRSKKITNDFKKQVVRNLINP
jgi:hypothetical protein